MGRKNLMGSVDFVRGYAPLAKEGKTALEIGQHLGLKGTDKQISAYVSVKASQLRKQLKEMALADAAEKKLNVEDTETLVESVVNKLPKLKGRTKTANANVMQSVLEQLNSL